MLNYLRTLDDYLTIQFNKKIKMKNTNKKINFEFSRSELKRIIKEAIREIYNPWKTAFFLLAGLIAFIFVIIGMSQPFLN